MTARLPSRLTQLCLALILSSLLPVTLLAGQRGGGGGHAGGGHSGGGHSGGVSAGHAGHSSGGSVSSAVSGAHGGASHAGPASHGGTINSEAGAAGGHFPAFNASAGISGRDAATEASLAHMASHGWHFLPSAGVVPAPRPARVPTQTGISRLGVHPTIGPVHPRPRGPYVFGAFPTFGFLGFGGFGNGCFFNGFTNFCSPFNGFGFYSGPCTRFGWNPCYPGGFGWWGPGWGWGGYSGFYPYDDSGQPAPPPAEDSYWSGQGMNIVGGETGETPPTMVPEGESAAGAVAAAPGQKAASAPAQLIFKNGSAYAVLAYWVSGNELYYRPLYGGTNHVPLDQLDLQATVEANTRAGVPFTLSAQPPQN